MATITKRTNKSGTYYYLVESTRVNEKPRIIKQIYLGTAVKIAKAMEQDKPGRRFGIRKALQYMTSTQ